MSRVYRQDTVDSSLQQMRRDSNGDLITECHAARVGVMPYPQPDGSVRLELVRPEELFDPRSMASLVGRPVTDEHPTSMFALADVPPASCGVTGNVRRDGRYLAVLTRVTDRLLASAMETKLQKEASPGYFCALDETPGVWVHPEFTGPEGERYDAVQGIREYDHLAVVHAGRCAGTCGGAACVCEFRTDSKGKPMPALKKNPGTRATRKDAEGGSMAMELCLKAYPSDVKGALEAYAALLEEMGTGDPEPVLDEKPPEEGKETASAPPPAGPPGILPQRTDSALMARFDALEAKNKALEAALASAMTQGSKDRDSAIRQRLTLERQASRVLGSRFDSSKLTDQQLQLAALEALYPDEVDSLKGATSAVVGARFEVAQRYDHRVLAATQNEDVGGLSALGLVGGAHKDGAEGDEFDALVSLENKRNGVTRA